MAQYSTDRIVTIASVRVTEVNSVLLSSYARLAGTKVETIINDLTNEFIEMHVKPHITLIDMPKDSTLKSTVKQVVEKYSVIES